MSLNVKCCIIIWGMICACLAGGNIRAEDYGSTARGMFIMLPTSIFENTPEGLGDYDKQELLAKGKSHFWEITSETPDVMVFTALPFRDRGVGMRIFRNDRDGSTEIAVGTFGEPICAVEMWRLDLAGRLIPVDTPDEPQISEFFAKKHKLGQRIRHSAIVCLGVDGLVAMPIFWNEAGMLPSRVDNQIEYRWNGHGFEKQINPREAKAGTNRPGEMKNAESGKNN